MQINESMMIVLDENSGSKKAKNLTCLVEQYIYTAGIWLVLDEERVGLDELIKRWSETGGKKE